MLFDDKAFCRSEIMLSTHVQVRNEVGRHGDSHNCTSLFWFEWRSWLAAPISRHFRTIPSLTSMDAVDELANSSRRRLRSTILSHWPMHRARLVLPLRAAVESFGLGCHDHYNSSTVKRPA
jgi:hypothetical protein